MTHAHELSIRLPATITAPRDARSAIDTLPLGEHQQAHFNLRLLVTELVTNSVRHADLSAEDTIRLEVLVGPTSVCVEVTDHGPGFARPAFDKSPSGTSGRGLYLVDALADRWGAQPTLNDNGWLVWFELELN